MAEKKALLVGHCNVDTPRIVRVLEAVGCEVFDHAQEVDAAVGLAADNDYRLVVGNRVIGFDQIGGLHLTEKLRAAGCEVPVLVLSAFEETQDAVVAAGAEHGFGKDEMDTPAAREVWAQFFA